jgi:hypothetical protein
LIWMRQNGQNHSVVSKHRKGFYCTIWRSCVRIWDLRPAISLKPCLVSEAILIINSELTHYDVPRISRSRRSAERTSMKLIVGHTQAFEPMASRSWRADIGMTVRHSISRNI